MPEPIRLALVGAGLFAREAHVPAIQGARRPLRDRRRLQPLARDCRSAAALLARQPGRLIPTSTPCCAAPGHRSGRHRFCRSKRCPMRSRKRLQPASTSSARSRSRPTWRPGGVDRRLTAATTPIRCGWWRKTTATQPAFRRAAEIVRSGEIGRVDAGAAGRCSAPITPDNKYYHTDWRRSGTFPGGFLLDGGVHHVAAFRQVVGEIVSVSAEVRQMRADLPPADTLSAVIGVRRTARSAATPSPMRRARPSPPT